MSELPAFLRTQEDLEAHVGESFKGLSTAEKGNRFASFASKLITFLPEFREFGEARLSEKASHDGGVDIVSDPLEDGRRLCVQSKLRITGKDDIDGIISKFHDFEAKGSAGPTQRGLFEHAEDRSLPVFGIVTMPRIDGILRKYLGSSTATRSYYDHLISHGRLHLVDGSRILRTLQGSYEKTFDVPSAITVRSTVGWLTHGTVHFGVMAASDLVSLYKEHGDGIFFENIRTFLGPTSGQVSPDQRTVNQEIAETVKTSPGRFLERNNGISIKATTVRVGDENSLKLVDASIVNGCQTTMTLVGTNSPLDECGVAVKVIESDHAWDVAKAANYQNTVDRIELELARYLRPQVVQRASASAGIVVGGGASGDAMSMLDRFYTSKVQYEEVRILYIGLMSRNPTNVGENNYTRLLDYLIMGLAADPAEQDQLIETLFRIVVATQEANTALEVGIGTKEYMKTFMRVFHERKPQYRILFAILTLCVLTQDDLSERLDNKEKEIERMRGFFRKVRSILDTQHQLFVSTYAFAAAEFAAKAWTGAEDENRVKQNLSSLLRSGFKGLYVTLTMKMDIMKELSPTAS